MRKETNTGRKVDTAFGMIHTLTVVPPRRATANTPATARASGRQISIYGNKMLWPFSIGVLVLRVDYAVSVESELVCLRSLECKVRQYMYSSYLSIYT